MTQPGSLIDMHVQGEFSQGDCSQISLEALFVNTEKEETTNKSRGMDT